MSKRNATFGILFLCVASVLSARLIIGAFLLNLGNIKLAAGMISAQGPERRKSLLVAEKMLSSAVAFNPWLSSGWYGLGCAREQLGDELGAMYAWQETSASYLVKFGGELLKRGYAQRSRLMFEAAVRADPFNGDGHLLLARAYSALSMFVEARDHYLTAIELLHSLSSERTALVLLETANVSLHISDVHQASRLASEAIALEPGDTKAILLQAKIQLQLGNELDADRLFASAVELSPRDESLALEAGLAYLYRRDFDRASAWFHKAAEINPLSGRPIAHLGLVSLWEGDETDAAANFHLALEKSPDDPFIHEWLAGALTTAQDLDGAASEYRRAISLSGPRSGAHLHLALAEVLLKLGREAEATAEAEKALEWDPNSAEARGILERIRQLGRGQ